MFDVEYEEIPMKPGLLVDYESIKNSGCGVVFPNPNAPTGQMCSVDFIRGIAEENKDSVILIDEAYVDFGGESCIGLVKEFENLMVVQTMSKSKSLAGMRIGLAFAAPGLIEGLERVRDSFNSYTVGRLAQYAGAAALEDTEYYDDIRSKIIKTREETFKKLKGLGFSCIDSKANFIFATHRARKAREIYEKLKRGKILVRYFDKPGIDNHVRITIGTGYQMTKLMECLEKTIRD
jgi:histidinol-phosphate aminotransferase